jgi:ABC-type transporter Mla subunit MlaD
MTEASGWVLVALAAVLVGAAVPVLLQLRKTLKTAEQTLDTTGRHLNEALDQLSVTLERVNRASGELEHGVKRVSSLLAALGGIGDALVKVRSTVGTVASLGSILGGAFLAAFGLKSHHKADEKAEPQPAPREEEAEEEPVR